MCIDSRWIYREQRYRVHVGCGVHAWMRERVRKRVQDARVNRNASKVAQWQHEENDNRSSCQAKKLAKIGGRRSRILRPQARYSPGDISNTSEISVTRRKRIAARRRSIWNIWIPIFMQFFHYLRPFSRQPRACRQQALRCIDIDGERAFADTPFRCYRENRIPSTKGVKSRWKPPKTLCPFETNIDGSLIRGNIAEISYTHRCRWNDIHNHITPDLLYSIVYTCTFVLCMLSPTYFFPSSASL